MVANEMQLKIPNPYTLAYFYLKESFVLYLIVYLFLFYLLF